MTDERPRRHPIPSTPDEAEQQGFDDATDWLVEAGGLQSFSKYFTPGVALDSSCSGCRSKWVCADNATCLHCRYVLGFTEGASK